MSDEQPPILKVRKDAERDVVFHYKREERLARLNAPYDHTSLGPAGFRQFFRKGRGWTLPLLIIVLGLLFLGPVLTRETSQARLAGSTAVLAAQRQGDAILASVVVSATANPLDQQVSGLIEARFLLPDTGAASSTSATLEGGTATLRVRLPATGKERRVEAQVSIGGSSARISAAVTVPAP